MAGTPGYPWPPYPPPSTHEGESQRAHLDATLRMLREQRPQIAAEIGEYLYSLVLQGQMRDPVVLATCRRLYDHEQQVLQVEASLRTLPAAPFVNQPPASVPPIPVNPSTGPPRWQPCRMPPDDHPRAARFARERRRGDDRAARRPRLARRAAPRPPPSGPRCGRDHDRAGAAPGAGCTGRREDDRAAL